MSRERVRVDTLSHETLSQRAWRLLTLASETLDLHEAGTVIVAGVHAGAHIAVLARQFPRLAFVADVEAAGGVCALAAPAVYWAPDGLAAPFAQSAEAVGRIADAVLVAHPATEVRSCLDAFDGFARIGARRDAGGGLAASIFGRDLARPLFRPRVRTPAAA